MQVHFHRVSRRFSTGSNAAGALSWPFTSYSAKVKKSGPKPLPLHMPSWCRPDHLYLRFKKDSCIGGCRLLN